jgi:hypothetical protein
MVQLFRFVSAVLICSAPLLISEKAQAANRLTAAQIAACDRKFHIDVKASDSSGWREPAAGSCKVQIRDGHRFPDPYCTPGALNPTVKEDTLRSSGFTTQCVRNQAESESAKSIVFKWYGVSQDSTCEKDHFIPLEIGGADTLDNIWPQCGPAGSTGQDRDFKQKDGVELYLGKQVKLGASGGGMSQDDARSRIAGYWPTLLAANENGNAMQAVSRKSKRTRTRHKATRTRH